MNALQIGDLRVKLPIVQGGMGVAVSLSGLASAVANAGGVGVISSASIGMMEPDYQTNFHQANKRALRKEIQKARTLTSGVLGVNIMMALTDHESLVKVAVEEKVDIIIMGAGLPLRIPALIEEAGLSGHRTKLVVKVSSAKAARLIFQYWNNKYHYVPDAVVVEGPLAGGHLGFKMEELAGEAVVPLRRLVEETITAIRPFEQSHGNEIPVIAAGGIYTGKDMFDIMQAGAKAVKLGTRFVTTHECDAALAFKETYVACSEDDITFISSPVGLPGRIIRNEFSRQILAGNTKPFKCAWHCLSSCNYKEAPYCISQVLFNAARGNMSEGFAFAGAKAYKATRIQSVDEVVHELITEFEAESLRYNNRVGNLQVY